MVEPPLILYGTHADGKTRFEKYLVIAWAGNPIYPVTLGHLPTIRPTKESFQLAEVVGYLVEGFAFDLDGLKVTQVKLEKEFTDEVEMLKTDWVNSRKTEMPVASKEKAA